MTTTATFQPEAATTSSAFSPASASLLEVDQLRVTYGHRRAVDGVSFSVLSGEIYGLLGPNGAGKTSALSAIEGLLVWYSPPSASGGSNGRSIRR